MFRVLSDSQINDFISDAAKSQHSQINVYKPIYNYINVFIAKHNLILSNTSELCKCSFKIYGSYIFQHANALANELVQFTPYVRLNTDVRNKDFTIIVDGTIMIFMHNIDPNFMKIMSANLTNNILAPEIELIEIYHKLYSPDKYARWEEIKIRENELWKSFGKSSNTIIEQPVIKGGDSEHSDIVLDWLKGQSGYAIVGDIGAQFLMHNNKIKQYSNAVQFIASNPKAMISSLREYMKEFIGANINVKKYDVNLPDDYRIRKFVISANIKDNIFYIANIFNSAFYELIPFRCVDKLNIGTPVVLLRFMFADIWFFRVLIFFGMISNKLYKKNITGMYANIDKIHSMWIAEENKDVSEYPMYIGTYVSESISKKENNKIFPYYPAKYKIDNGEFRSIEKAD